MAGSYSTTIEIRELALWEKLKTHRILYSFDIEVTARCPNNCRHCYINLPASDRAAMARELTLAEIDRLSSEAVELGAMWCLITGGEPLLRQDFADLYMLLKHKGLLVSVFTTATLINEKHIAQFKKYPPRDIEVTVYGVTRETYEAVTRRPGSFAAFQRGLDLLLKSGVKVRLKAMALRSNVHEMDAIARFCRERTKDYFRFDPMLHLRYDGDPIRNAEIRSERLSPQEVVALERADSERFESLQKQCDRLIIPELSNNASDHLFHCGAGTGSFDVGYDGTFRLCSSLNAPGTTCDLRRCSVKDAWENLVPKVRNMRSDCKEFLEGCQRCSLINLCLWCPANAFLETGEMDAAVPYFCAVAHARAEMLQGVGRQV